MSEMIILGPNGSPFKTKQAATEHAKSQEMPLTRYIPVKHSGGWALADSERCSTDISDIFKVSAEGTPFPSKNAAAVFAQENDLELTRWIPIMHGDGWALADSEKLASVTNPATPPPPAATMQGGELVVDPTDSDAIRRMVTPGLGLQSLSIFGASGKQLEATDLTESHYWVSFSGTTDAQHLKQVELTWEGHALITQRNIPAVLPRGYLEVALHAKHQVNVNIPGQDHKEEVWVHTYPFSLLKEATQAEYDEWLTKGNAVRDDDFHKMGITAKND